MRPASSAIILCGFLAGCTLSLSGLGSVCSNDSECLATQQCIDGRCVTRTDGGPQDAGRDGGGDAGPNEAGTDAGPAPTDSGTGDAGPPPAHCSSGALDGDETAVDCGGSCPGCAGCLACAVGDDCASGTCIDSQCAAVPTPVGSISGMRDAYVRPSDGAILLAHYGPNNYVSTYNTSMAQEADTSGGRNAAPGWAPDPCVQTGHLPFTDFDPSGREVVMECGIGAPTTAMRSATVFDTFTDGVIGTYGAPAPGWGAMASLGSPQGRTNFGMCGTAGSTAIGGIAYCANTGTGTGATDYTNHSVSYSVTSSGQVFVGCSAGFGCADGSDCPYSVWVWLLP